MKQVGLVMYICLSLALLGCQREDTSVVLNQTPSSSLMQNKEEKEVNLPTSSGSIQKVNENEVNQSISSVQTQGNTHQTMTAEQIQEEYYKSVFEDYDRIVAYMRTTESSYLSDAFELANSLNHPIHVALIETAMYENMTDRGKEWRYSFYDLNQDGVSELLVGSVSPNGEIYFSGLYYLQNGTPTLLAESYVGSGSARGGTILYQDGEVLTVTWSPGLGSAEGILYQLQPRQEAAIEVDRKHYRIDEDSTTLFGKTSDMILELDDLDWKQFDF